MWTVRTALMYWANDPAVVTLPEEVSHTEKKQMSLSSIGNVRIPANLQYSLNAFHCEEMALRVLGAHACLCMNRILLVKSL